MNKIIYVNVISNILSVFALLFKKTLILSTSISWEALAVH